MQQFRMKRESKLSRKIYERVCQVKADERNEKKKYSFLFSRKEKPVVRDTDMERNLDWIHRHSTTLLDIPKTIEHFIVPNKIHLFAKYLMGILKFFTLSRLCRRNFDGKDLGRGFRPLIHISFKETGISPWMIILVN